MGKDLFYAIRYEDVYTYIWTMVKVIFSFATYSHIDIIVLVLTPENKSLSIFTVLENKILKKWIENSNISQITLSSSY